MGIGARAQRTGPPVQRGYCENWKCCLGLGLSRADNAAVTALCATDGTGIFCWSKSTLQHLAVTSSFRGCTPMQDSNSSIWWLLDRILPRPAYFSSGKGLKEPRLRKLPRLSVCLQDTYSAMPICKCAPSSLSSSGRLSCGTVAVLLVCLIPYMHYAAYCVVGPQP